MTDDIFGYIDTLDGDAFSSLEPNRLYSTTGSTRLAAAAGNQHKTGFVVDTESLEPFACLCPDGSRCGWDCRIIRGRRVCTCDCSNCG